MPRNQLVGGFFQDYEGHPLSNGYLILELSSDASSGLNTPQFLSQEDGDLFLLEDGSGFILLETSPTTGPSIQQLFLQEDGSSFFLLEDGSGFLALQDDIIDSDPQSQILGGLAIRIQLDMLGNIAGTRPAGFGGQGYGEGGYGDGPYGGAPNSSTSQGGPSVWPNDDILPTGTVYYVNAYKYDGTKAWLLPQQWSIPSVPSPFDVGTFGTYPIFTPTPNIVDVLPALVGIIPTSRFIPGGTTAVLIQVNGTNAGSQTKLNLVAGTGMTITDDGIGDITFAAATGSGNAPLIITTASTSGALSYGATPWTAELDTSGAGGITRTLPTAVGNSGSVFVLKKIDSGIGAVTIATTGGQTIDGSSTWLLTNQYQYVAMVSDGSNFQIFSNN